MEPYTQESQDNIPVSFYPVLKYYSLQPMNSDKCFRNVECRFFPCHENIASETFNCLFCYCPLYFTGNRCGGNFEYVGKSRNVKSCSQCTFPHDPNNYDLVIAKLEEIIHGDSEK